MLFRSAYLELIENVCDLNLKQARRIEHEANQKEQCVDTAIASLEEYIKSYRFFLDQSKMDFKDDNVDFDIDDKDPIGVHAGEENQLEVENRSILNAPIIKSRAGDILYHCSLILSDANVDIRLNVLQLASKSMRLLRSYEGKHYRRWFYFSANHNILL